jgi:hypothetical protein
MSDGTRLRISATLILVLVFGSGVLVGLALDRAVATAVGAPSDVVPAPVTTSDEGEEAEEAPRRYVIDEVPMEIEQRSRVDSILASHRQKVDEAAEAHQAQYSAQVSATREAIRSVLTDEQRDLYDSLLAEARAAREQRQRGGQDER